MSQPRRTRQRQSSATRIAVEAPAAKVSAPASATGGQSRSAGAPLPALAPQQIPVLAKASAKTPPKISAQVSVPLAPSFFQSKDTVGIARALVGAVLCRRLPQGEVVRMALTEVEAYDGPDDKACHAHKGRTKRTEVLFGPPAHFYVYLCYGVHWLLNVVTGPLDYPAAVLVRGAGAVMGPGRLTRSLQIDSALNKLPVAEASGLWLEAPPHPIAAHRIIAAPRIGIAYAGPDWANRPYRFTLAP